jgi:hypothetical protein
MKGKRKHRETGGVNEAEEDLSSKTKSRNLPNPITEEADEKKKGGRVKKARGGKTVGVISGPEPPAHAGRKPRASGGRSGSEKNPFTSANKGNEPKGHKTGGPAPIIEGEDQKA